MHSLRQTSAQLPHRIHSEFSILLVFIIFSTSSPIKQLFVQRLQLLQTLSVVINFKEGIFKSF